MTSTGRLPLRRPLRGRAIGGVAAGLAAHLAVPVAAVRLVLVLLVPLGGAGAFLYVWFWVTVPAGDPAALAAQRPAALSRLAPHLRQPGRRLPLTDIGLGLVLLVGAGLLVAARQGVDLTYSWAVPALIGLGGTALAWSQLDTIQRDRVLARAGGRTPVSVVRLLGGTVLAGLGVFLLVGRDEPMADLLRSAVAAVAVLAGAALVLAPWWLRLVRELGDERAARAREAERADIAAHLHDSVLQTLALIRARATQPEDVARLARAQERELRAWLYDDRPTPGTSLAAELHGLVAEVEDARGAAVETVVVGDRVPDAATESLLQATREALVNAVVHGRPPFSLYLEARPDVVEVFVRDHGDGFELDEVPADRFGVRESIIGRITRRGGTATVVCRPERGTEVHLSLPVAAG
ncbi:PspC domain-containing protein [Actinotalea sp.]|uniref:PspC domain-containing protein n=1 Tax=Actinotalea sp. TaxID=1872145 RepID=UPI002BE0B621|nr:PspC domain-containing protein [Actinotalea sp.]HQY33930.1 PspC domain-containing protein [Actinotalea sp.]HRA50593.1 PspC domain-containing protein [Actinotalea sp.]